MHWLAPWWWLLFIPLAGGLVLLYLLKLRRREHLVPSVYLWEHVLQDLQANAPLQKLRTHLLLLIQLLLLLCVVAALTRPAMRWQQSGGRHLVLIMDASASMQSTDVAPSRFDAAKQQGHKLIEALGARDQLMLIAAAASPRTLTPYTDDKRTLHGALDRVDATDCAADLRGSLELVANMARGKAKNERPHVVLISDGAVPKLSLPTGWDMPLEFVKVGKDGENVGIVIMDVRRHLTRAGYEGIIGIENFGKRARACTLELWLDTRLQDARTITLGPGARRTEVLPDLPVRSGKSPILRAVLDVNDTLAADNEARIILPSIDPVDVVLATPGNVFLRTALDLDPSLHVTERKTVPAALAPGTVLIADTVPVAHLPARVSALVIGPQASDLLRIGRPQPAVTQPTLADWDRRSPVLQYVDLHDLHIRQATPLTPRGGAAPLIETAAGPLALTHEAKGQRVIWLGWDLHDSDFPLRAGFPIFVSNCIDWLSGQRRRGQTLNVGTGRVVLVPVPPQVTEVTLHAPDGHTERLGVTTTPLPIDRFTKAGLYRVSAPGGTLDLTFAVNLLDAAESQVAPRAQLAFEGRDAPLAATRSPIKTDRELWRPLLLLGLLLLCLEWWVFHRRIG